MSLPHRADMRFVAGFLWRCKQLSPIIWEKAPKHGRSQRCRIGFAPAFMTLLLVVAAGTLSDPPAQRRRQLWRFGSLSHENPDRPAACRDGRLPSERGNIAPGRHGVQRRAQARPDVFRRIRRLYRDDGAGRDAAEACSGWAFSSPGGAILAVFTSAGGGQDPAHGLRSVAGTPRKTTRAQAPPCRAVFSGRHDPCRAAWPGVAGSHPAPLPPFPARPAPGRSAASAPLWSACCARRQGSGWRAG